MFFLVTYLLISKYYPNMITQLIIGCSCYILSFFVIRDFLSSGFFEHYKYYIMTIFAADVSFFALKYKKSTVEKFITDTENNDFIMLDADDYKITHEIEISTTNPDTSIFSDNTETEATIPN